MNDYQLTQLKNEINENSSEIRVHGIEERYEKNVTELVATVSTTCGLEKTICAANAEQLREDVANILWHHDVAPLQSAEGRGSLEAEIREALAVKDPEGDVKEWRVIYARDLIPAHRKFHRRRYRQRDRYPLVLIFISGPVITTLRSVRLCPHVTDLIEERRTKQRYAMGGLQGFPLSPIKGISIDVTESGMYETGVAKSRFHSTVSLSNGESLSRRYVHGQSESVWPSSWRLPNIQPEIGKPRERAIVYVYRMQFETAVGPTFIYKIGNTRFSAMNGSAQELTNKMYQSVKRRMNSYSAVELASCKEVALVLAFECNGPGEAYNLEMDIHEATKCLTLDQAEGLRNVLPHVQDRREYRLAGNGRKDLLSIVQGFGSHPNVTETIDHNEKPLTLFVPGVDKDRNPRKPCTRAMARAGKVSRPRR